MKYVLPDYTNCGLNVVSSVLREFGAQPRHATHPLVDEALRRGYRHVALMLFDGMGMDVLRRFLPEDSFLRTHIGTVMTAVYPSTTTCATTCIECGVSPREHGWLGWTLYFKEIDKPVDIFINRSRGEEAADYHVASRYMPRSFVFPQIDAAGKGRGYCVSRFTDDHPVETLDELFDTLRTLCSQDEKNYVYTYWADPDHEMHERGCADERVGEIVMDIDRRLAAFARELPTDTLLMVTADHGLIDARHYLISDYPELTDMLVREPSIEARAAGFYVKPERLSEFPDAFRRAFGDHFQLYTHDAFIDRFLGDGEKHPKLDDVVGDYVALAVDRDCIDVTEGQTHLKGVHAGLTEQEMLVPLVMVKNREGNG